MKTFLFIISTILVQQSIQYENAEEGNLLHPEKPLEKHEEDSHNLKRGDIKYLTNIKDYDTGDFQPYNGHYQNYYQEIKDKKIMRPLRELRSASEIKNFVKDMIVMRGRGRRPYPPPYTTKKPRPPQTTKKPKPNQTTEKSKGGSRDYIRISASFEFPEEEQILLEYIPKHKKVDVPMIIFVPSRE